MIKKVYSNESLLWDLSAQSIKQMQDLNRMYGFLGNYDETIFLRQHLMNSEWPTSFPCRILPGWPSDFANCFGKATLLNLASMLPIYHTALN